MILLLAAFLVAVIGLTVAFAARNLGLRPGPQTTFVVYVLCGCLAAVLTFGILRSAGTFKGSRHGGTLEFSGALIPLVLVVGGGMVYEKYFRVSEEFSPRFRFVTENGALQPLTGSAILYVGSARLEQTFKDADSVLFQGVSRNYWGTIPSLDLRTPPFQIAAKSLRSLRLEDATMSVVVNRDATLERVYGGSLRVMGASSEGTEVQLVGTGCIQIVKDGAFKFVGCPDAERLVNPRVRITLPNRTPCRNEIALVAAPLLTAIRINTDCTEASSDVGTSNEPLVLTDNGGTGSGGASGRDSSSGGGGIFGADKPACAMRLCEFAIQRRGPTTGRVSLIRRLAAYNYAAVEIRGADVQSFVLYAPESDCRFPDGFTCR